MIKQIRSSITGNKLIEPGRHALIAVSGGADSVSLLHVLHEIASELRLTLTVAHLNHCLRGDDSDEDARFVMRLAERLKCGYIEKRANVTELARREGISIEMAARTARYSFFTKAAISCGASVAATAHTADDQAETVLLKLSRGAGPGGLSGISRRTVMDGLTVVRPMLDVSREQVLDFLNTRQLSWREDRSNDDVSFLRNRIRHIILPLMEKGLNPKIKEAIRRTAGILSAEDQWLNSLAAGLLKECAAGDAVTVKQLLEYPEAARRRVLRLWLSSRGIPLNKIDFDIIEEIESMIERGTSSVNVPGGMVVRKRYGKLTLMPAVRPLTKPFKSSITIPGETVIPEQGLRITVTPTTGIIKEKPAGAGALPARATLSAKRLGKRKLSVRSWKQGDRVSPLGMTGSKKVQDIFVDEKVPVETRGGIPIIACGGEIIWIPGYRIARGWEVPDKDADSVQIYVERI